MKKFTIRLGFLICIVLPSFSYGAKRRPAKPVVPICASLIQPSEDQSQIVANRVAAWLNARQQTSRFVEIRFNHNVPKEVVNSIMAQQIQGLGLPSNSKFFVSKISYGEAYVVGMETRQNLIHSLLTDDEIWPLIAAISFKDISMVNSF